MSRTEISPPPIQTQKCIDVRVTIDTDSVPGPLDASGDAANPTSIDQAQGTMVVPAGGGDRDPVTGDVVLKACPGDTLRFFLSSGSNNFDQAVLLEDVRLSAGDAILGDCDRQGEERAGIAPASQTEVLPARFIPRTFQFGQCQVSGQGTGTYALVFPIFHRDDEGQPYPIGHYRWVMKLTV